MDFSGCEAVKILFREESNYSCSVLKRNHDEKFEFDIVPCESSEKGNRETLEILAKDVISRNFDPALPFFSTGGSFWTGSSDNPLTVAQYSTAYVRYNGLLIGGEYLSIAAIPISVVGENIGLLQLFCRQRDQFSGFAIGLYESVAQALGVALTNQRAQAALRERIKELTCLYGIATLSEKPDVSPREILQGIVDLLPAAWQYPEITSARIIFDNKTYISADFIDGDQRQKADLIVHGKHRGFVEVVYQEPKPQIDEGPFLKEERSLIDTVALQAALIIEQKQAEEDRLHLQDQLRHADRLATIGQLAAGVAHELNEPLGGILGFAQLVQKNPELPAQIHDDIDKIINAALHAREVVKKLMLFARQMPTRKTMVDVNKMVREGLYFLESRCQKAGIEMVRRLAPDIPRITADQSQIYQVLVNLAVNSVQAMPNGGKLIITTEAIDGHVTLTVEDTGIGMNREVLNKLFIPFFTTKDIDEGTGLGLSVVHGIVTSHGGTIKVESEVGHGTRFEIQLPVTDEYIEESDQND